MIQQLFAIARNTFTQSIRQPIYMIIILIGIFALVINTALASNTFKDDNIFMISSGLSTIYILSAALAAFIATGVLTKEIQNKTVLTVVSKPVPRPLFILGKFLGIIIAQAAAYTILAITLLLCIRHGVMQTSHTSFDMPVITFGTTALALSLIIALAANYYYHWVFTSTFIYTFLITAIFAFLLTLFVAKKWTFQTPETDFNAQHIYAIIMIFQAITILTAFAIMLSTKLKQVSIIITLIAYLAIGSVINNAAAKLEPNPWLTHTILIPFARLNFFWPGDAIIQQTPFNPQYLALICLYATLFTAALLAISFALFQTKDVG